MSELLHVVNKGHITTIHTDLNIIEVECWDGMDEFSFGIVGIVRSACGSPIPGKAYFDWETWDAVVQEVECDCDDGEICETCDPEQYARFSAEMKEKAEKVQMKYVHVPGKCGDNEHHFFGSSDEGATHCLQCGRSGAELTREWMSRPNVE